LKGELMKEVSEEVLPLLRDGRFVPVVPQDAVFNGLEASVQAHEAMDVSTHAGKIVVCPKHSE
jgi:NADPH:quinone reductase-like Zn-dependent oxidoreductase